MKEHKMSRSEAGLLGSPKGVVACKAKAEERLRLWNINPKLCAFCNNPISYDKKRNNYCSRSCAAKFNNIGVNRHRESEPRYCYNCNDKISIKNMKYCSSHCQFEYEHIAYINKWLSGNVNATRSHGTNVSNYVRRWMKDTYGNKCSICGGTEWMGKPIPLVLDHIDGNSLISTKDNLRLVCGNCNMQLPTFSGRNKGSGRISRMSIQMNYYNQLKEQSESMK